MNQTTKTGRPRNYPDETVVCINAENARTKLQKDSERRAIINRVIEAGGKTTIAELVAGFGFDIRGSVAALIRAGWLTTADDAGAEL